jgi:hypothetical protein
MTAIGGEDGPWDHYADDPSDFGHFNAPKSCVVCSEPWPCRTRLGGELDAASARVAELEAENERLRAVANAAQGLRAQVDKYGHAYDGAAALDALYAALDAAPAREA